MATTLMILFGGYGILQSIFLNIYVLTSQLRKINSNLILVALNILLLFFLADSIFIFLTNHDGLKYFNAFSLFSLTLIGPLMLLYARSISNTVVKNKWTSLWHFIPPLALAIIHLAFDIRPLLIISLYLLVYLISSLFSIYKERHHISFKRRLWLYVLYGSLSLVVVASGLYSLQYLCIIGISIGFSLGIYLMSYLNIRFFNGFFQEKSEVLCVEKIQDFDSLRLYERISIEITDKELYKNSDLTLPRLAELMDSQIHKLSHAINNHSGNNFPEFINTYRLEEAKRLLKGSNMKIAAIAYECGFNALSTFYTYFKNKENMTPTAFRKCYGSSTISDSTGR